MFSELLEKYRNKLHLNKRQMADKLELSESYYNMIENNNRPPSKVVLNKLVSISELSEEYWLYGINTQDYINNKDDFKNLRKVLDTILELCVIKNADDLFNNINLADNSISKLLIKALKKDIDRFIEK
jgi:transcriptional regulator with XRE-family HTH domain